MNVRGLAVAMFCAAVPLSLSCAQSDDIDGLLTPASSSTGGAPAAGLGGGGRPDTMAAASGGSGSASAATGGSTGQPPAGGAGPATGGATTGGSGGVRSSTGTGGTGTGGSATGGSPGATGGSHAATGGSTGATGGATGASGGSIGTTGGHTGATGGQIGATGGSGAGAAPGGTIVPLYTDPTDPSWDAMVTAALAHPTVQVVAIVNPSDGPGPSKSQDYVTGIATLIAAKIKVIGYVATGYGSHSIASMEAEIDTWKSFYPQVEGIFFDEQSTDAADVSHYQTLSQYAKSKGLAYTVGNPGTDVPAAYVGALDTMLIYESDGLPALSSLKAWSAYAPSNFGIIPYKCSMDATFVKQARAYVQYVYLQSDDLPNPWDSLTPFFSDLLASLE